MKNKVKLISYSSVLTFVMMFLFESAKELLFKGNLTSWQSHWITISFTTMVSLLVVLFVMNKLLILEQQKMAVRLKEEKLKSIKQVMYIVHHHVNNLANSLELIEVEIEDDGTVCKETLAALNESIKKTAETMKLLADIDNPDNDDAFKIEL